MVGSGANTIDIYGKNTPYTNASDLYGTSAGTKIGSCNSTSTITVTGDYQYIGIRSNSGALYLSRIEITYGCEDSAENVANYIMYEDDSGQCNTKTTVAKGYFEGLSQSERATFMQSDEFVIKQARERLLAWLRNQGMDIELSNSDYVVNSNRAIDINSVETKNNSLIIVISVSIFASSILIGTLLIKRKKHQH